MSVQKFPHLKVLKVLKFLNDSVNHDNEEDSDMFLILMMLYIITNSQLHYQLSHEIKK